MTAPPDLRTLTEVEKDALIRALWAQVQTLTTRVAELEARLNQPPKTPGNSSLPPSRGHKANRPERAKRPGPRQGSLGRAGGGRPLAEEPDQLVIAKAATCAHCRAGAGRGRSATCTPRYDKVELPPVRPVVTRVERYPCAVARAVADHLAPVPEDGAARRSASRSWRWRSTALHPRDQLPAADPAVFAPVSRCRSARVP